MIKLDATTKSLEVDLTSAITTNQLPIYTSYSDISQASFGINAASSSDTQTNSTTAVTAVSAPLAATTRKIDLVTVYNADTVDAEVTVSVNNNGTLRILVKETIEPGETLQYTDGSGWAVVSKKKSAGWIGFRSGDISASQDFILIDISDTTNYPHTATNYVNLGSLRLYADAYATADYIVQIGFLENVDATNGDFYPLTRFSSDKQAGQSRDDSISFYPYGARCQSSYAAISGVSENDTAFQTDVNLASTLDPGTADTPSGSGDIVARVTINAGTIVLGVECSYHTH